MNTTRRLYRDETNKMLGGVCAGLAEYFGVDVTLVRIGVVLLGLATHAFGLLAYLLLWAIMPTSAQAPRQQ
jgi:phage shock protein C